MTKTAIELEPAAPREEASAANAEQLAQVWSQIQAIFAREIGAPVARAWLAPLELRGIDNGTVTLAAPSRFAADWLKCQYGYQLEALWRRHLPGVRKLEIVATPRPPSEATLTLSIAQEPAAVQAQGAPGSSENPAGPHAALRLEYRTALQEFDAIDARRRRALAQARAGDAEAAGDAAAADEALEACQAKVSTLRAALEAADERSGEASQSRGRPGR